MRSREDLESYLLRTGLPHEAVDGKDLWVVREADSGLRIVVTLAGDLVVFRAKVMDLAGVGDVAALSMKLLELNATELAHGAYGVADGAVVLVCALRLANLDFNEFSGTIDDFSVAMVSHKDALAAFRG